MVFLLLGVKFWFKNYFSGLWVLFQPREREKINMYNFIFLFRKLSSDSNTSVQKINLKKNWTLFQIPLSPCIYEYRRRNLLFPHRWPSVSAESESELKLSPKLKYRCSKKEVQLLLLLQWQVMMHVFCFVSWIWDLWALYSFLWMIDESISIICEKFWIFLMGFEYFV